MLVDGTRSSGHGYTWSYAYILGVVTKRLVDIDDDLLDDARSQLGTATIKDTVNEALRLLSATPAQPDSRT